MAHRLPSAGIPTPLSEHFEFFRVHPVPCCHTRSAAPSCQPWENNCFLRPRFIAFDSTLLRILTQKKPRRGNRRQERTARSFSSEPADVIVRRNECFCFKLKRDPVQEGTGMFEEKTCPEIPLEIDECCACPAQQRPASRIASDECCIPVTQSKSVRQNGTRPKVCHKRSAPTSDDIERPACQVVPSVCQIVRPACQNEPHKTEPLGNIGPQKRKKRLIVTNDVCLCNDNKKQLKGDCCIITSCRPVVKGQNQVCSYLPPSAFDRIYNIPVVKLDTKICQPFYGRRKTEFEHQGIC